MKNETFTKIAGFWQSVAVKLWQYGCLKHFAFKGNNRVNWKFFSFMRFLSVLSNNVKAKRLHTASEVNKVPIFLYTPIQLIVLTAKSIVN